MSHALGPRRPSDRPGLGPRKASAGPGPRRNSHVEQPVTLQRKLTRGLLTLTRRETNAAVPPSPMTEEKRAALTEAEHGHGHGRPQRGFYRPAHRLLQWGEVQHSMHAAWGDLFYDLIMVGAAFRTGDFLKENINYYVGPLVMVGCGVTWLSSWSHLLQYRCRFSAKSLAHKLVDVIEGLSAAAAAHNIVKKKDAFEEYYMYAFLFWVLVGRGIQACRRLEIVLLPETDKEIEGSARYAAADVRAAPACAAPLWPRPRPNRAPARASPNRRPPAASFHPRRCSRAPSSRW